MSLVGIEFAEEQGPHRTACVGGASKSGWSCGKFRGRPAESKNPAKEKRV